MIDDGIAAILRRDHHWSGNFLQDGGEEIYRNGTEGSNPACSSKESATNLTGKIEPALARNRRFESSSLQRGVCELSVP